VALRINPFTRLAVLSSLLAAALPAAEGIPRWEQVLNDMLARATQPPPAQPPTAQPPNALPPLRPIIGNFITYFQTTGAKTYRASLARLQTHRPTITRILREERLPQDLIWLGLVESGYNPAARSPRNAVGIWQLIPETAAAYGLKVSQPDERTDPEKSTRAAARYLKSLYARFGDWALTLAAYNAGEGRVQSAIDQARGRDFWHLSESGLLPRETQAYVPAVLAAQLLAEGRALDPGTTTNDEASKRAAKVEYAPFSVTQ
jgi:membrane-bound lytic murein transglycosylase D